MIEILDYLSNYLKPAWVAAFGRSGLPYVVLNSYKIICVAKKHQQNKEKTKKKLKWYSNMVQLKAVFPNYYLLYMNWTFILWAPILHNLQILRFLEHQNTIIFCFKQKW
jgi:hypothetical protein